MGVLLGFFALQHRLHYIQPTWRVAGLSRRVLQHGILSAFLSYGEDSRTKVDDGQIVMAMIYDVPNLVNNGFMSLVALANAAGKLIIILIFQILVPPLLGRSPTLLGLAPALCIPGITCIFLLFRVEHQTRMPTGPIADVFSIPETGASQLRENVRTFRLISDFGALGFTLEKGERERGGYGRMRRPGVKPSMNLRSVRSGAGHWAGRALDDSKAAIVWGANDTFQEKIASFNKSAIDCAQMIENNAKFVEWLHLGEAVRTTMFVSIYTIWAGIQVIDGSLGLGLYITNIGVFNAAGAAGSEMCHVLLQMQKVTPSLDRLVKYINLPTDLIKRKNLERHRRIVTARLCGETTHERGPGFVLDKLPIIISELEFQYPNLRPRAFGGRMEFPQGKLMAIVGGCGQGKSTLLRMLAGRNLPRLTNQETSLFFIPSHIQVLYVPHSPIFFHGTLYDNLVYGVRFARHEEDANVERVVSICRRLKLPAQILETT
ncbi:unnamed protein product [Effrenium voratum]|nr:unnamed protein product [Effrenium voratum]